MNFLLIVKQVKISEVTPQARLGVIVARAKYPILIRLRAAKKCIIIARCEQKCPKSSATTRKKEKKKKKIDGIW